MTESAQTPARRVHDGSIVLEFLGSMNLAITLLLAMAIASAVGTVLQSRDGYLVQPLPFTVSVTDFRIRHYATGQPKSFESALKITAPDLDQLLEKSISVNHLLIYKGYTIYQASFSDAGSGLTLNTWPLPAHMTESQLVTGAVQETLDVVAAMVDATVTKDGQDELLNTYFRMLQTILGEFYVELLKQEGVNV